MLHLAPPVRSTSPEPIRLTEAVPEHERRHCPNRRSTPKRSRWRRPWCRYRPTRQCSARRFAPGLSALRAARAGDAEIERFHLDVAERKPARSGDVAGEAVAAHIVDPHIAGTGDIGAAQLRDGDADRGPAMPLQPMWNMPCCSRGWISSRSPLTSITSARDPSRDPWRGRSAPRRCGRRRHNAPATSIRSKPPTW